MADILIKGIQFPKFSPHVIEVYPDGTAIAHGKGIYGKAVPVPPHRRLIDADELKKGYQDICCGVACEECSLYFGGCKVERMIDDAPTVIPADKDGKT